MPGHTDRQTNKLTNIATDYSTPCCACAHGVIMATLVHSSLSIIEGVSTIEGLLSILLVSRAFFANMCPPLSPGSGPIN